MPLIRPFRALHYGSNVQPLLGELVTPAIRGEPLDRREVGDVHEFNIRRLVRGDFGPLARPNEPSFSHAARLLQRWKEQGIIVRDPRPALYVYEQQWGNARRRGLVTLVRLDQGEDQYIRAHEETLGGATDALLAQLKATSTQLSMTMAMIQDRQGVLAEFLNGFDADRAGLVTLDGMGMHSRVWRDEDPAAHLRLVQALEDEVAVVADGHHRHLAALAYQQWVRDQQGGPGRRREHSCDYIMMMLVPVQSQGLSCQPTHRVCEKLNQGAAMIVEQLDRHFELEDVESEQELLSFLGQRQGHRFALIRPGRRTTMLLKPAALQLLSQLEPVLHSVDAAVLEQLVLGPMDEALGKASDSISDASASGSPWAHNRSSAAEVSAQVLSGRADLAILVRPPPPDKIMEVALSGAVMPAKSTNFYPKPIKGLLMSSMRSF